MRLIWANKGQTNRDRIKIHELRKIILEYSKREKVQKARPRWFGEVKRIHRNRLHRKKT